MNDKFNKNIPPPIVDNTTNSVNVNTEQSKLDCSIINAEKFPTYKDRLKSYINEIALTAFSKEGVRYLANSFVSMPCNVYISEYTVHDKSITDYAFSDNFANVKQVEKDKIIKNIEIEIKQDKDFHYPILKERPIILSLPSDDGIKGEWQIDTIQIVKSLNKFVLTGHAGSGKTIIARRFALELIEEKMFFPIYIQLNDYFMQYSDITLYDISSYISTKYEIDKKELYELIICQSNIYFILDGIDEIYNPTTPPNTICQRLNNFINEQDNIILTSREGYSGLKELKTFPIVKIEKIKDKHIRELFLKYCDNDNAEVKFEDFKNKLTQIPQELRDRPLFVVLLTILFEKEGKIPDNKITIYEKFINFLMFQYKPDFEGIESINGFVGNRKEDLIYVLEEIAYKTLIEGNLLNNNAINSILTDRGFEKTLHCTITKYLVSVVGILENKPDGFGFVHKSFCEYLSAKKICRDLQNSDELYSIIQSKIDILKEPLPFVGDILRANRQMSILRDFLSNLSVRNTSPNWTLLIVSRLYQQKDYDVNPNQNTQLKSIIKTHLSSKNILPPKEQSDIVKMLGLLGDDRIGVSVDENDIPNIHWCKIEKGKFNFGLSEIQKEFLIKKNVSNSDRDLPEQELELEEYNISKYPITIVQYSSFLKEEYLNPEWWNYSEESKEWFGKNSKNRQVELIDKHKLYLGNYPANFVNWYEAKAFCKWFGKKVNLRIDLPSIQQWEKAIKSYGDFIFSWGNEYEKELCNINESNINDTCPVGCFNEVENAPLDMCGNVWEWCLDKEGEKRIVRGGSFCNNSYNIVRATFNGRDVPDLSVERQGFRIVQNIGEVSNNSIRNFNSEKAQCQITMKNVNKVTMIDHKKNNGRSVKNESVVFLKYSVAYSENDIKEEKNLIQNKTKLKVIVTRDNLNSLIYDVLCLLNETDTIIVKVSANEYAKGCNYDGLFNLSKDLFFEIHIISVC